MNHQQHPWTAGGYQQVPPFLSDLQAYGGTPAAGLSQQLQHQQQPQQHMQPRPFFPPHLRHTVQPQQDAPAIGLMGLLAAHRSQAASRQHHQSAVSEQCPEPNLPPSQGNPVPTAAVLPPTPSPQPQLRPQPPRTAAPPPGFETPPHQPLALPQPLDTGARQHHAAAATAAAAAPAADIMLSDGASGNARATAVSVTGDGLTALTQQGQSATCSRTTPPIPQAPAVSTAAVNTTQAANTAPGAHELKTTGPHAQAAAAAQGQTAAPAISSSSVTTSSITNSQQQQQQQEVPQVPPGPHNTLQDFKDMLHRQLSTTPDASHPCCNLGEGLKWLQGFAPEASQAVDGPIHKYFKYIRDQHGPDVLTNVVFFCFGHHHVFRGASLAITLDTADHPNKVLNQRASFYRLLFSQPPSSRASSMATVVAYRPDVATWLNDKVLRRLFDKDTPQPDFVIVMAALLLLPEGWELLLGQQGAPRSWLENYVKAVLQSPSNAQSMAGLMWRKADAARQRAAAARQAGGKEGRDPEQSTPRTAATATTTAAATAAADPNGAVQAPAVNIDSNGGSSSSQRCKAGAPTSCSEPGASSEVPQPLNLLQQLMQQQLEQEEQTEPRVPPASNDNKSFAAMVKRKVTDALQLQQDPGVSRRSSSTSTCEHQGTYAAAAAAAAQHSSSTAQPHEHPAADGPSVNQGVAAAGDGANGSRVVSGPQVTLEIVNMALVQLVKERPDVAQYLTSSVKSRLHSGTPMVAFKVVGALHDLPLGWHQGLKEPHKFLLAEAMRAEAAASQELLRAKAAAAAGTGGKATADENGHDGDGWIPAEQKMKCKGAGGISTATSVSDVTAGKAAQAAAAAAGGGNSKHGAVEEVWRALKAQCPDVWVVLDARHRDLLKPLTQDKQKRVLRLLLSTQRKRLVQCEDPADLTLAFMQNCTHIITKPLTHRVQEALQELAEEFPDVVAHMDEGMLDRICHLPQPKALLAVRSLQEGDYQQRWQDRCRNPSAWLMGIMTRGLRSQ